ncbi:SRPBCC family protein [Nocardioides sp. zg-DK7169]|uniref:SRPBCC family protein n=1 Tax=Nocardioides sp. zg-DK7169 TaxID=2736600 RepID=UPI001554275A|nr:SRPBCC family protein [Nocardioides sp. zg-DK7169]NPC97816.1 SRPBCC family protein [Nocardioides sp. zg-DK7169]
MRPRLGIDVDAPGERAWEQLVDVRCWPRWGPTVRDARLDDGTYLLSAGATGSVQTAPGVWLPFRVERWREDESVRSWSWRVAGVPATEHTVIARGPSRCRVEMGVPWWGPPYLVVVAVALRRIRRLVT